MATTIIMNAGNSSKKSTASPAAYGVRFLSDGSDAWTAIVRHFIMIRPLARVASQAFLTCLLGLGAAGCDEGVLAPSAAREVTWSLESIETGGLRTSVPEPDRYTLRLSGDGRVAVRADCNTCASSYTLDRDVLSMATTMACTRAFCGASSLDAAFLSALSGSRDIDVSESNMTVRGSGTVLRFRR